MIVLEDRITLSQDIEIARVTGARQEQACEIAGIDVRTLPTDRSRLVSAS